MKDLHSQIMNLPCSPERSDEKIQHAYKCGHRDARHAAAELALEADAEIERLRNTLKNIRDITESRHDQYAIEVHAEAIAALTAKVQ